MITRLGLVCVWVFDQDVAREFYVDTLGCKVVGDMDFDGMHWLSVSVPDQPDVQFALNVPGPPIMDEASAASIRDLVAKGYLGHGFTVDDCAKTYEELKARGVDFVEAPEERVYGIDAAFRDPFGNSWRMTQLKPM